MARLPTIASRPTPRRKHAVAAPSSPAEAQTQVTKAAKRAAKRAQLLRGRDGSDDDEAGHTKPTSASASVGSRSGPTLGLTPTISKSALRRRKRKQRDEQVLGEKGLDEMRDQLGELEEDDDDDERGLPHADDGMEEEMPDAGAAVAAALQRQQAANQVKGRGKVGDKMRKRVL